MCWITKKQPVPHFAEENITVYKYVEPVTKRKFPCFWKKKLIAAFSDIFNYKYYPYIENRPVGIHTYRRGWDCPTWEIEQGYHSVMSPNQRISEVLFPNVKFIIPKGSRYYVNEEGEIVSSRIIMTDELVNQKKHWKSQRS